MRHRRSTARWQGTRYLGPVPSSAGGRQGGAPSKRPATTHPPVGVTATGNCRPRSRRIRRQDNWDGAAPLLDVSASNVLRAIEAVAQAAVRPRRTAEAARWGPHQQHHWRSGHRLRPIQGSVAVCDGREGSLQPRLRPEAIADRRLGGLCICLRSLNRVGSQPTHEAAKTGGELPEPAVGLRTTFPRAPAAAGETANILCWRPDKFR